MRRGLRPRSPIRLRRRFSWRGIFGRESGKAIAKPVVHGVAAARPLGESRRAAFSFEARPSAAQRIARMRRLAVIDIFDQIGLAPMPGHLWRFIEGNPDPVSGIVSFFNAIGIDPARIKARDPDEIDRANEVLELLFGIDTVFDRIAPEIAAELEAKLCSGDYAGVRLAAQVVKTFETIAQMEHRWPPHARLGVLDSFLRDVRAGLADPLAVREREARAAARSAEVLDRQMVAFDAEVQENRRLLYQVAIRWPKRGLPAAAVEARRKAAAESDELEKQLLQLRRLRKEAVDDGIARLRNVNARLRHLLDRIDGRAAGREKGGGRGTAASPARSEFDRALEFFRFAPDARPDRTALRQRFRELARKMHPDLAGADCASQREANRRFVELNRYYDVLKLRL
ncbi:MAG: hypothetical protein B7Y45_10845 [Sphingomonas sp. 28-66-16]|nr:MAG: hypothetical protein B7Y45_10845 [Sphingomonas sp. 28-66-16]